MCTQKLLSHVIHETTGQTPEAYADGTLFPALGIGGLVSLGHAVFFGIGGYAMGMYLMRQMSDPRNWGCGLPSLDEHTSWVRLTPAFAKKPAAPPPQIDSGCSLES